ncbi:hypothetical protein BSL78_15400 [Apostichopus japonicus]|uniref:Dehydrogenase/reductase SDR family member 4 n=1 Tax=Stichopus japonicus TaxID=307972 RepID=A0A2G8KI99_STIJA|nr:hypothetical protein BSL78_15400 [Apostichopus japonicus]
MSSNIGRFVGKVAVCTGATQGIGFATAKRLGEEGAKVVVSSRKEKNVKEAVKKLKDLNIDASGVVCHQGQHVDRKRLIDHALSTFGGIDLLYANAGVNPHKGNFLDITEEQWDKLFHVNLKSVFLLIRDVLPHMEKRGGGAIVTNSSANAYVPDITPASLIAGYAISKLAQISMVKILAEPCAEKSIRINAIAPGPINTAFLQGIVPGTDITDVLTNSYVKYLKRAAEPDECAGVVAFLLSPDASYITGDCLTICGGYSHRL